MAVFCTQCGASNAAENAFCDQCGTALRARAARPAAARSKKPVRLAAALGGLLLLGGGALYVALAPPAPSSARLLAAAKASHGEALGRRAQQALCLSNMDYSSPSLNAAPHDQRTLAWLDTLVQAGLYSPGTPVAQSGFFAQNIVQYRATPELAQWLDAGRLCLAKGVAIVDVVEIGKPTQETLGRGADSAAVQIVAAQLLWQAVDAAPWLDKAEVHGPVLERVSGWTYQRGKLHKQTAEVFALHQGQWVTGLAYKAQLGEQNAAARRASRNRTPDANTAVLGGGFLAGLTQFFRFGGHPLEGTWRIDGGDNVEGKMAAGLMGMAGLGEITFTRNTMKVGNEWLKCHFEVHGQQVNVVPEGKESQIFEIRDKNTLVMSEGFVKIIYKRVP